MSTARLFLGLGVLYHLLLGLRSELIQLVGLGSAISSPRGVQGEAPAATQNMKVCHFPDEMDEPKLRGGGSLIKPLKPSPLAAGLRTPRNITSILMSSKDTDRSSRLSW